MTWPAEMGTLEFVPKWKSRAQALTLAFTSEITSKLLDLASIHKPDTICTLKHQQWEMLHSGREPDGGKRHQSTCFLLPETNHSPYGEEKPEETK